MIGGLYSDMTYAGGNCEKILDDVEMHPRSSQWLLCLNQRTLLLALRRSEIKFCNPLACDAMINQGRTEEG